MVSTSGLLREQWHGRVTQISVLGGGRRGDGRRRGGEVLSTCIAPGNIFGGILVIAQDILNLNERFSRSYKSLQENLD